LRATDVVQRDLGERPDTPGTVIAELDECRRVGGRRVDDVTREVHVL
jgi:hypothetical protein